MSAKPVVPRERAPKDIEDAVDYYAREAGEPVALAFINAVESAYGAIARRPALGSPRYVHELNLPGLRGLLLKRYTHILFYIEREDPIDLWRVLHARRDIPAWMRDADEG